MERVAANWGRTDVDWMMTASPLIEVEIPGLAEPQLTPSGTGGAQ